ncbi:MAG: xanthine dehydrogenase accessory protein XdhC [Pseudomonadota bacterium]
MADLRALTQFCLETLKTGENLVFITQCAVEGSTPRELGVRMAVTAGSMFGTIGGGNLEQIAIDQARKLLTSSDRAFLLLDLPLGPLLAQCCGGHVRLLIERLDHTDTGWLETCAAAVNSDQRITLQTTLEDEFPRKRVVDDNGSRRNFVFQDKHGADLSDARPPLAECKGLTEHFVQHRPKLYLYGAGHVGRATAEFMRHTVFDVTCYDNRDSERTLLPPGITIAGLDNADAIIETTVPYSYHVVFTHSHELDYAVVEAVLRRGDFAYLGLIGSQTKRSRFMSRLREGGLGEDDLARLTCPIGTPGITSKAPEAVAVALAHELLACLDDRDTP